jgi:hypothetical protein
MGHLARMNRLLVGLGLLAGSTACDMKRPNQTGGVAVSVAEEPGSPASNDVDALAQVVRLPRRPNRVQWRKAVLGRGGLGPTDWSLTALLEFSEADAKVLLAGCEVAPPGTELPELGPWLPQDVRENAAAKVMAYDAAAFFRSPLLHGALFRLGQGPRFLLYLHTM